MEEEESKRRAAKREAEAQKVKAMANRVYQKDEGKRKASPQKPTPSRQSQVMEEAKRLAQEDAKRRSGVGFVVEGGSAGEASPTRSAAGSARAAAQMVKQSGGTPLRDAPEQGSPQDEATGGLSMD